MKKHVQVYNVWVNGYELSDPDQQFPVNTNIEREWGDDLRQAVDDYFNARGYHDDPEEPVFDRFIVTLFSFEVDVEKFENETGLDFDLSDERVQECLPYHVDYDFNVVAERTDNF